MKQEKSLQRLKTKAFAAIFNLLTVKDGIISYPGSL